jgi:putative ABC transport system ATP-binding protein
MSDGMNMSGADHDHGSVPAVSGIDASKPLSVSVRHVNHFFGTGELRKQTLFDNQLDLARGEIVVMTGPSGSGKTTLLTLIGALRSVQEGELTVLGEDLHSLDSAGLVAFRQRVGFIFQAHNLFGSLTAEQNVRMALDLGPLSPAEASRRARDLLGELGLGERVAYTPARLSGGQRQRVAIARALANRPGLILADEPTAALDANSGRIVMELLKRYSADHGTTVIVVTHDQRVLDAADRIVKMVDGRISSDVRLKAAAMVCNLLRNCEMFTGLPADTLSQVAGRVLLERHAPGAVVVRQGEAADTFYVIVSGHLEVTITDEAGSRVVRTLGAGDFFGEVALLKAGRRTATVTVTEAAELLSLRRDEFDKVVAASSSFEERLRQAVFERQ